MKKWGGVLSFATLCVTLGISREIVIWYLSLEAYEVVNSLRIFVNAVEIVYLLRLVFAGKFD